MNPQDDGADQAPFPSSSRKRKKYLGPESQSSVPSSSKRYYDKKSSPAFQIRGQSSLLSSPLDLTCRDIKSTSSADCQTTVNKETSDEAPISQESVAAYLLSIASTSAYDCLENVGSRTLVVAQAHVAQEVENSCRSQPDLLPMIRTRSADNPSSSSSEAVDSRQNSPAASAHPSECSYGDHEDINDELAAGMDNFIENDADHPEEAESDHDLEDVNDELPAGPGGEDFIANDEDHPEEAGDQRAHDNMEVNRVQETHMLLRNMMRRQGFGDHIDTPLTASALDLLYMALAKAIRHNESNEAFYNNVNLLNSCFASPVLPVSKDILDNILKFDVGVSHYFFCVSCRHSFGKLDFKNIKTLNCEHCDSINIISDLRKAHFFVMFDVSIQLEILLNTPTLAELLLNPLEAAQKVPAGTISDICSGSMYKSFAAATSHLNNRIISFHFSTDGSPLAKSSNTSIWPIQLAINELPSEVRMCNTLLAGLWFGKNQPPMDLFLKPFVSQFRNLSQGVRMMVQNVEWLVSCFVIGSCVDSGARGKVQGLKTHSGYHSCNWCEIRGVWMNGAVRFPLPDYRPQNRTHHEIIRLIHRLPNVLLQPQIENEEDGEEHDDPDNNLKGVQSVSPLINLPQFDMVDSFFVDAMHLLDVGLSKAFLTAWLENTGEPYCVKDSKPAINNKLLRLRPPIEFRRMVRSLEEVARYKSKEWQNWLQFLSVPVMTNILPQNYLKIWHLLVQAVYLLNQEVVSIDHVVTADKLITQFLVRTQISYGEAFMSFNLHILKHLCSHVLRWGQPWASSAYFFESGNGSLKQIIHSGQGVPHQIIRSLSWKQALKILETSASQKARDYVTAMFTPKSHREQSISVGKSRLIGKPSIAALSAEEFFLCEQKGHNVAELETYNKVFHNGCVFTPVSNLHKKTDNSVAQLLNKEAILIRRILFDRAEDKVIILASDVVCQPVFIPPEDVHLDLKDHCVRSVLLIHEELKYFCIDDLKIICFRAQLPNHDYIVPFANVHNRF